MKLLANHRKYLYLVLTVFITVYLIHFINIIKYAVNVPYWDEWESFNVGGIIANPTIKELFAQHNEHRIVTENLLTLFLYYLDGWNIITHQILNFIIYGLLVSIIIYVIKQAVPSLSLTILLIFAVFLFSTVNYENHFWAFQSQFHLSLLFMFLSVWFLFNEKQNWKYLVFGVLSSWLTIYSLSSGLIESLVIVLAFACFKLLRLRDSDKKQQEIIQLSVVVILIVGAIALYFVDYVKPSHHPALVMPYQLKFWIYYFNLLSGGFGYKSETILPGIAIFLFVTIPIIGEVWKRRFKIPSSTWIMLVLILATLGALGSITMGRAGFDVIAQSKSSRYSEIVEMLIPLSIGMWTIFLREKEEIRSPLLAAFWMFCVISFATYWSFAPTYKNLAKERLSGVQCIKNYYANGGEASCPTIYPAPIAARLEFAKTLNLSFIQEAQK